MNAAGVVDDYLGMLLATGAASASGATPVAEAVAAEAPAASAAVVADPVPSPDAPRPLPAAPAQVPAPVPLARRAPAPAPVPAPAPAPAPARAPGPAPARPVTAPQPVAAAPSAPSAPQQRRAADRSARWLRLRCGAQAYAIELLKIREVVLPAPLLALRGAAPCLAGVMNLRGQVVPVVDLGLQLGAAPIEETAATRIVVLEDGGDVLGLRVSSVEDVVLIGDAQIEGTHTSRLAPVGDHRIRGIARLGGAVMLLLDANRLLALPLFPPR